jgi:hypothetical protein
MNTRGQAEKSQEPEREAAAVTVNGASVCRRARSECLPTPPVDGEREHRSPPLATKSADNECFRSSSFRVDHSDAVQCQRTLSNASQRPPDPPRAPHGQ